MTARATVLLKPRPVPADLAIWRAAGSWNLQPHTGASPFTRCKLGRRCCKGSASTPARRGGNAGAERAGLALAFSPHLACRPARTEAKRRWHGCRARRRRRGRRRRLAAWGVVVARSRCLIKGVGRLKGSLAVHLSIDPCISHPTNRSPAPFLPLRSIFPGPRPPTLLPTLIASSARSLPVSLQASLSPPAHSVFAIPAHLLAHALTTTTTTTTPFLVSISPPLTKPPSNRPPRPPFRRCALLS
mmetsp:Transcript_16252/g.44084  ORF Transcript_16252/g.44084 Transcript_16252/m.44084 type:complete len:244 (+) Transcript_16252:962-1693(+)